MPFYQDEWELLLEFYEPAGNYTIETFAYIEIIRWGIMEDRIRLLHKLAMDYPQYKLFDKMQVVSLFGKLCQNAE